MAVKEGFFTEVINIHIALRIAGHNHDLHAGHHRRCGIGSVSRGGDQRNVTMHITARPVIGPNDHEAGVFTLCA